MAKNTSKAPLKWQVWADNNGLSSNYIQEGIDMIKEQAAELINDEDGPVYSSAKIYSMLPDKTESGAVASFSDAIPELPIVEGTFNIDANLDGVNKVTVSQSGADTSEAEETDIDLSSTCYGGNVKTDGTITITYGHKEGIEVDTISSGTYPNIEIPTSMLPGLSQTVNSIVLMNKYEQISNTASPADKKFKKRTSYITIYDSAFTDLETANAILAELIITYELNASAEASTDPITINTLTGENNIWCDTGDTSITYKTYPS